MLDWLAVAVQRDRDIVHRRNAARGRLAMGPAHSPPTHQPFTFPYGP